MARSFYYGTDAALQTSSARFSALINASPESLGISVEAAEAYAVLDARYTQGYRLAIAPETRTIGKVAEKNDRRAELMKAAASLVAQIDAHPGLADSDRIALGIVVKAKPSRLGVPEVVPVVHVVSVIGRVVTVRIGTGITGHKGCPDGVASAGVYSYVGEEPPASAEDYKFEGLTTRRTYDIIFPNTVANGSTAWVSVNWNNPRGQAGKASAPLCVIVQGGAALPKMNVAMAA